MARTAQRPLVVAVSSAEAGVFATVCLAAGTLELGLTPIDQPSLAVLDLITYVLAYTPLSDFADQYGDWGGSRGVAGADWLIGDGERDRQPGDGLVPGAVFVAVSASLWRSRGCIVAIMPRLATKC